MLYGFSRPPHTSPHAFFSCPSVSLTVNAQNDLEGQALKMAESLSARVPEGLCDAVFPAATLYYGSKE